MAGSKNYPSDWHYLALFSQINFFTWSGHCKKLKLIGNLSDYLQILTVGRLTHKQQKHVWEFFLSKYFYNESDFVRTLHIFLILFQKCSDCNFSLKLTMANRRHVFLVLWPWKRRNTLNKQKTKFALTCNVQKVIRALAFRSCEKFNNSFFF